MSYVNTTLAADGITPALGLSLSHMKLHRPATQGRLLVVVMATGTFGGGTLNIHVKHPAHSVSLVRDSMTAAGVVELELPVGYEVHTELTGATTPSVEVTVST